MNGADEFSTWYVTWVGKCLEEPRVGIYKGQDYYLSRFIHLPQWIFEPRGIFPQRTE